jgi:hypothetical protein
MLEPLITYSNLHFKRTTCPRSFSSLSGLPFCLLSSTAFFKLVYAVTTPNKHRVPDHHVRHIDLVQVARAAGFLEAWTTRANLLLRTRNRRLEAIRDGGQDSGQVLLWVALEITSSIASGLSPGRHRRQLRMIGKTVYLGRRSSGVDVRLLPLITGTVGRALLTSAR